MRMSIQAVELYCGVYHLKSEKARLRLLLSHNLFGTEVEFGSLPLRIFRLGGPTVRSSTFMSYSQALRLHQLSILHALGRRSKMILSKHSQADGLLEELDKCFVIFLLTAPSSLREEQPRRNLTRFDTNQWRKTWKSTNID